MATLRSLIARIGFQVDAAPLAKVNRELDQTKKGFIDAAGRARDASGKFLKAGEAASGAAGGLNKAARAGANFSSGFGGGLKGLFESLFNLKTLAATVIGGTLIGGIKSLIESTFSANSEFESLKTRLETLLGPEKAVEKFKELEEFAKKTPFELNELADAFINLSGPGFDVNDGNLTALGDIAAAAGKPLGELVNTILSSSRGLASMVDNFSAVGISARSVGGKLELVNDKLGTKKLIDPSNKKELMAFFVEAGKAEGVAGGMGKLSATLGGLLSTLKDNVAAFFRTVGASGFNDAVRELFQALIGGADTATPAAEALGKVLGSTIQRVTSLIKWLQEAGGGAFGNLARWIGENSERLLAFAAIIPKFLSPFGPALILFQELRAYFTGGSSALGLLLDKFSKMGGVFANLALAASTLRSRFGEIMAAVRFAAGAIQEAFAPVLAELFSAAKEIFGEFKAIFVELFGEIAGGGVDGAQVMNLLIEAFKVFAVVILPAVVKAVAVWLRFLIGGARIAFGFLAWHFSNLAKTATMVFGWIKAFVGPVFEAIVSFADDAFKQIQILALIFGEVFGAIWQLIQPVVEPVFAWLVEAFGAVVEFIGGAAAVIGEIFGPLFSGLGEIFGAYIEFIFDGFRRLLDFLAEVGKFAAGALGVDLGGLEQKISAINAGVQPSAGKAGAAGVAAPTGAPSLNQTATVGAVTVNVSGSTQMGPNEIAGAARAGLNSGLQDQINDLARNNAGGAL